MRRKFSFRETLICLSLVTVCVSLASGQTLIDHTCTDTNEIPSFWIDTAVSDLHIAYNHTSHGSHIISGMNALMPLTTP